MGRALWRELVVGFASQLGELNLGFTQLAALYVLAEGATTTIADLAEAIGRSPSATSRLVDGLVRRRLVERRREEDDGRQRSVWLTARGRAVLRMVDRARAEQFLSAVRPHAARRARPDRDGRGGARHARDQPRGRLVRGVGCPPAAEARGQPGSRDTRAGPLVDGRSSVSRRSGDDVVQDRAEPPAERLEAARARRSPWKRSRKRSSGVEAERREAVGRAMSESRTVDLASVANGAITGTGMPSGSWARIVAASRSYSSPARRRLHGRARRSCARRCSAARGRRGAPGPPRACRRAWCPGASGSRSRSPPRPG